MGDSLDLRARIAHRVEGFGLAGEGAVGRHAAAARLAEVDVAGQLANDQDVEARDQLGLQARRMRQLLVADRGAEVGEELQVPAQAEDGLLGAQRTLELVVLPVADRAEQHRVGFLGELQRGLGQRMAVRLVGGAADQRLFRLERQVEHAQHLHRLGDDLDTDAVTRQDCNLHESDPFDLDRLRRSTSTFSHSLKNT